MKNKFLHKKNTASSIPELLTRKLQTVISMLVSFMIAIKHMHLLKAPDKWENCVLLGVQEEKVAPK